MFTKHITKQKERCLPPNVILGKKILGELNMGGVFLEIY